MVISFPVIDFGSHITKCPGQRHAGIFRISSDFVLRDWRRFTFSFVTVV